MVTNTHALDVIQVRSSKQVRPVLHHGCGSSSVWAKVYVLPSGNHMLCQRSCKLVSHAGYICTKSTPKFPKPCLAVLQGHSRQLTFSLLSMTACLVCVVCAAQVAVGARHAALLTRGGEVYTWGSGQGGQLGNGTSGGTGFPYQVGRNARSFHMVLSSLMS
jgi:hypothetical protein